MMLPAVFVSMLAMASAMPAPSSPSPQPRLSNAAINASHRSNSTIGQNKVAAAATSTFWYANVDHTGSARGYAPDLDSDYSYAVYKTVNAGDGNAIQAAISSGTNGDRNHEWLASQPRVVYLPPGTYDISSTINLQTDTIIMGDATDPPVLKATANFNGNTLFNGQDPATNEQGELSFAGQLKNIVLDTTAINPTDDFTALYWGVAQACALVNVRITMPHSQNGNGHTGIRLGRGSTISVSDTRIEAGQVGISHSGHQQAMYKNIYFYQNTIGFQYTGGNTISIIAPTFEQCGTGVADQGSGGSGQAAWIAVIDGVSKDSGIIFNASGYPNFMIENLVTSGNSNDIAVVRGNTVLPAAGHVDTFWYGNTVGANPVYQEPAPLTKVTRSASLAPGGSYYHAQAPSYADKTAADFINVKDTNQNGNRKVLGDQTIDEAPALNAILQMAADQGKIAYFPFGKYRVDSTLVVPPGCSIVGEGWATITGNGDFFADESNPKPVVMVGEVGSTGVAQIQDMRFTVSDVLPGAIVFQVNMAGNPGDVALFNSLITIGGTRGSQLPSKCGDPYNQCKGAFMNMHLAKTSSAYIDNVWVWVADHIAESFDGGSNIAVPRGVLVEATKATWLSGLGSEHHWFYNLNLRNAQNVFTGLLQTESNYDQGDNAAQVAPAPWTADVNGWGDPDFSWCSGGDKRCRMTLAQYISGGSNIFSYAAGSWSFFSGPGYQGCNGWCQTTMNRISSAVQNLQLWGLGSKDTQIILHTADGQDVQQTDGFTGSWTGLIAAYRGNA